MTIVFQIIFGLSVAGVLILAFRKIPVLLNYPRHPFEEISLLQKITDKLEKIKEQTKQSDFLHNSIIPQMEKILRRIKIFVLKFDNFLAKAVGHLRKRVKEKEEKEENKENNNEEMPS